MNTSVCAVRTEIAASGSPVTSSAAPARPSGCAGLATVRRQRRLPPVAVGHSGSTPPKPRSG